MFFGRTHAVFCRPLGLVTGSNALNLTLNACLAGVPSDTLKMSPVNQSLFSFISP